jgi:uncharacterized protein YlbG (UPF0298 family)
MKQFNFQVVDVPADGNCYYHAIVQYLETIGNTGWTHRKLRVSICNYMYINAQKISDGLNKIMTRGEIRKVAAEHMHGGVFTDNEIIQHTTMDLLGITLRVYFRVDGKITCWNPRRRPVEECCNVFCDSQHFQLLELNPTGSSDDKSPA